VVAVPGGLLFAAGAAMLALQLGAAPRYASQFLPAVLLTGTGVGLLFAGLGSAAVAELPRSRYATGSAISSTFRQLGAVLGISGLIAVLGTPGSADALDSLQRVWALVALTGAVAAGVCSASSAARVRPGPVSRYRCRGGRPAGASVSQEVSSRPRSASRIRIGYTEPALSPSCWHSW
jgi:hypothetical protein